MLGKKVVVLVVVLLLAFVTNSLSTSSSQRGNQKPNPKDAHDVLTKTRLAAAACTVEEVVVLAEDVLASNGVVGAQLSDAKFQCKEKRRGTIVECGFSVEAIFGSPDGTELELEFGEDCVYQSPEFFVSAGCDVAGAVDLARTTASDRTGGVIAADEFILCKLGQELEAVVDPTTGVSTVVPAWSVQLSVLDDTTSPVTVLDWKVDIDASGAQCAVLE